MKLFLIRHAQSANNALPEEQRVEDPPLTPLGHRQAAALAAGLQAVGIQILIASPFRRALETAEPLRKALNITPQVWIDLHEQGGCYSGHRPEYYRGSPGMNSQQIRAGFPEFEIESAIGDQGWWGSRPYESEADAARRARRLWHRSLEAFVSVDCPVGFVMHADFKRLFLTELFARHGQHDTSWPGIYNTAVTAVEIRDSEVELKFFNSVAHLSDELISS